MVKTKKELKQDYKKINCVDSARFGVTKKTRQLIEADNLDNMAVFIEDINQWSKKYSSKTVRGEVIDELNRILTAR